MPVKQVLPVRQVLSVRQVLLVWQIQPNCHILQDRLKAGLSVKWCVRKKGTAKNERQKMNENEMKQVLKTSHIRCVLVISLHVSLSKYNVISRTWCSFINIRTVYFNSQKSNSGRQNYQPTVWRADGRTDGRTDRRTGGRTDESF